MKKMAVKNRQTRVSTDSASGDDDHPVIATEKKEAPSMVTRAAAANLASSQLRYDVFHGKERCGHDDAEDVHYVFEEEEVDLISNVSSLSDGETSKPDFYDEDYEDRASNKNQAKGRETRRSQRGDAPISRSSTLECRSTRRIKRWETHIWGTGEQSKKIYVGSCNSEEAGARIYDRAYIKFRGNNCPNFPYSDYEHEIFPSWLSLHEEGSALSIKLSRNLSSKKSQSPLGGFHNAGLSYDSTRHMRHKRRQQGSRKLKLHSLIILVDHLKDEFIQYIQNVRTSLQKGVQRMYN
ncbi:hypothetical protein SELMODRAFT_428827 [Selaginella moellendorffii]|uniref:AP2/ERF domain-containing protein n=1 Tax=Selaginella moellendorffii TaxID=88036 RepID=D8T449_SELML|nr:hypothetical protein SELMODRAFT_428827 [Selaginella moellendorffii]